MAVLRSSTKKLSENPAPHKKSAPKKRIPSFTWDHLAVNELLPGEIEQCYRLVKRIKPLYIASGETWTRRKKLSELEDANGLEYILLRSPDGTVLGFASFTIDDEDDNNVPSAFLWEFHLKPQLQRLGVAQSLMEKVCSLSTSGRVTLRVFSCNKTAVRFYQKFGFQKDEKWSTDSYYYMYWISSKDGAQIDPQT